VDVANELRPVLLRLNRELRRELGPLGITGGQAALLHAIRSAPGVGIGDLARRECVSTPAISTAVSRLESAGLVERVRGDADRRRVGLSLTAHGERVLAEARSRRTAWLADRLRRLPADDLAAVHEAGAALRRLLEGE
jgi:DNA-binding MarR family transcriptional regulator